MSHYFCVGECGGQSDRPGVCQSETCFRHGQPLIECECTDGKHIDGVKSSQSDDSGDSESIQ